MSGRPIKRSVLIAGHRTSVSLEVEFWDGLKALAETQNVTVAQMIAKIDAARGGADTGLSSALRIAVLRHYQQQSDAT